MTKRPSYLTSQNTFKSWFAAHDHKRIGLLYFFTIILFFFIGGVAAFLMRIELMHPHGHFFTNDTYNRLFTMHGVIMVWFFLIPSIPTVLGNFLIPLMIGAPDLAYPKLNLASWYLFITSGVFTLVCLIAGGVDTGWTFYTPYSTGYANSYVSLVIIGVFINGFSSIFTGLNFMVTIHRMRPPGSRGLSFRCSSGRFTQPASSLS